MEDVALITKDEKNKGKSIQTNLTTE